MRSDNYYLGELEDKLLETVNDYVHKVPRPFGVLLSGGLDSGFLAAVTKPDKVYTIRFTEYSRYDESRYADAIIEHLGLLKRTTIITPTREDFHANFEKAVKIMGESVSHFSLVPLYIVFELIGRTPNQHILSGEGPDEYLGGYARQIIFDELNKLWSIPELRHYHPTIEKLFNHVDLVTQYGLMMKYDPISIRYYAQKWLDGKVPLQGAIGEMDMTLGVIETMEQRLAESQKVHLHYPFLSDKFAQYCYQLPDHLKIRNGVTKWAFREICKKYLPDFVINRCKMGGPVAPVNHWLGLEGVGEYDKKEYIKQQKAILAGQQKLI